MDNSELFLVILAALGFMIGVLGLLSSIISMLLRRKAESKLVKKIIENKDKIINQMQGIDIRTCSDCKEQERVINTIESLFTALAETDKEMKRAERIIALYHPSRTIRFNYAKRLISKSGIDLTIIPVVSETETNTQMKTSNDKIRIIITPSNTSSTANNFKHNPHPKIPKPKML